MVIGAGLRRRVLFALLAFAAWLAGCATLPPQQPPRPPTRMLAAPESAPLARAASSAQLPPGLSGFWPMPQASFALDARLAMIRHATTSIDLQYYLIANDTVGRAILRELRDAAARGVRVRLLVDDLYTQDIDGLLQGLQAQPNVEVRLFNPFVSGRGWSVGRFFSFVGDFRRLNHRMHNKLFVADGALAVLGGRNLADEYFLRAKDSNFLDMDILVAGPLVARLGELFDVYWNSERVFPLRAISAAARDEAALREDFERATAAPPIAPPAGDAVDYYGAPPLSATLGGARPLRLVAAEGGAHADSPDKVLGAAGGVAVQDTVTYRFVGFLREARSEIFIFSPYFIPGEKGLQLLREARSAGIEVRVVTNALATSDEPLVNFGYERYRDRMLEMGIKVYELSAARLTRDPTLKKVLGSSRGRLHAKMAFVDRKTVLVGSMNMDLRSALTNTEIGIRVASPELAQMILDVYRGDGGFAGVYEVKLKEDGSGVQWIGEDPSGEEVLTDEPEVGLLQRLRLWFLSLFIPEDLL